MVITNTPGTIKKFGRTPWRFQRTFKVPPRNNVASFINALVGATDPLDGASLTIDNLVLEPTHLIELISATSNTLLTHDVTISVVGREAAAGLLESAMCDIGDFLFTPKPRRFVVYADRNQRATLFAVSKANLSGVTEELSRLGFQELPGYRYQGHPETVADSRR